MMTDLSLAAPRDPSVRQRDVRRRVLGLYAVGVVVLWASRELTWWWRRKRWRAHGAVPWQVRRSLGWAPPTAGSKRR